MLGGVRGREGVVARGAHSSVKPKLPPSSTFFPLEKFEVFSCV